MEIRKPIVTARISTAHANLTSFTTMFEKVINLWPPNFYKATMQGKLCWAQEVISLWWSGYGEIVRYIELVIKVSQPSTYIIAKHCTFPFL